MNGPVVPVSQGHYFSNMKEERINPVKERKEGGLRSLIVFTTLPSVGVFGNDL